MLQPAGVVGRVLVAPVCVELQGMSKWTEVWRLVQKDNDSFIKVDRSEGNAQCLTCSLCNTQATLRHIGSVVCVNARSEKKIVLSPLLKVLVKLHGTPEDLSKSPYAAARAKQHEAILGARGGRSIEAEASKHNDTERSGVAK